MSLIRREVQRAEVKQVKQMQQTGTDDQGISDPFEYILFFLFIRCHGVPVIIAN